MKQFVFNSSWNSPKKHYSTVTNTTRLEKSPTSLFVPYTQRESIFGRISQKKESSSLFATPRSRLSVISSIVSPLPIKSVLNVIRQPDAHSFDKIVSTKLPARRKRLRSLSRANFAGKKDISVLNPFFFLHQANFFSKTSVKIVPHFGNAKTLIIKKGHIPLLLNSAQSELNAKNQRFGSSWENGLTVAHTQISVSSILSLIAGTQVSFVILPALSLARYAFDFEAIRTARVANQSVTGHPSLPASIPLNSARFLRHLEQEISSRFQYVAVQIPDLLRVSFTCIYFKKPAVLSNIFAQTLSSLPRNRKETQFLRFLIKVVKVFSAQRTERLGVRLRFKGRVNRWRRTKHIIGEKGRLPLYTYSARLERGEAQAITRKGTLGIRIWFAYHPSFARSFRRTLLSFVRVRSTDSTNLI